MHVVECLTHSKLGGAQSVVFSLVKQLSRKRTSLRITIMLPKGGVFVERFRALGVEAIEFPLDRLSLRALGQARRVFSSLRAEVLHSHGKGAGIYAGVGHRAKSRACHVHSYHGFHMPGNFVADSLYLTSERFLIRRTDATIAVSTDEASELQRIFQDDLPSVTIIPNVVDCDDLRARGKAALPDACTTFLNRNANRFVVVMIARNDPVKNYSLALNATLRVLQRGTNTAFAFVGITERDARRLLHTGDFSDRIICIDELENPAPMLRAASAILLTSRKESSPLVVQEARCFGKPVIGTDVPGIRENVRDRHDGVLCSENPEAVAEAILLLATDTSLYDRCANAACRLAEVSSVKAWANQYLDFYTYIHAISRG